jgi:hypothetical protein
VRLHSTSTLRSADTLAAPLTICSCAWNIPDQAHQDRLRYCFELYSIRAISSFLLDILLEDILELFSAPLGVALAVVFVIDVDAAESCLLHSISTFLHFATNITTTSPSTTQHAATYLIPLRPLKIIHQAPPKIPPHINPILGTRLRHRLHILLKILDPKPILQDLIPTEIILMQNRSAILRHIDRGMVVAVADPVEQGTEAGGVGTEPGGLRYGADGVTLFVFEEELEVADVVGGGGGAGLGEVFDVVGAVVVLKRRRSVVFLH